MTRESAPAFTLLTRTDCGLCAGLRDALHAQARGRPYSCDIRDVDEDAELRARWALRVPVLLRDGRLVCEGHADLDALEREFAPG